MKNEGATLKAFRDGWFATGDLAVSHPDGRFEIKDRARDVIISGGENILSVEVRRHESHGWDLMVHLYMLKTCRINQERLGSGVRCLRSEPMVRQRHHQLYLLRLEYVAAERSLAMPLP